MATAATGSSWADLHSELLVSIAATNGLSLRDYTSLRAVCAGWRYALVPPHPCLLSFHGSSSVFSLPLQRRFQLHSAPSTIQKRLLAKRLHTYMEVPSHARVVGSGNGRLAIAIDDNMYRPDRFGNDIFLGQWTATIFLLDPRSREEPRLLPPPLPFSTTDRYECLRKVVFAPDHDDGTVVAMCDRTRVAYIDTGRRRGDMVWKTVDVVPLGPYHLADLAFDPAAATNGKVYCLDSSGGVRLLRIPRGRQEEPSLTFLSAPGPAAFAPPYARASELTFTKHLFFYNGSMYQLWQNTSSTVRSGSRLTMPADGFFVLKYDAGRCPCWDAVKDLGGCSVFIGNSSSPAVVRAGAVPGVRGDCVYWIDWLHNPMVCDVATGTSKPCLLPYGTRKAICWYFGDEDMASNNRGTT